MSVDRQEFGEVKKEISQKPEGKDIPSSTYLQELRSYPAEMLRSFTSPPPSEIRPFLSSMAQSMPTLGLTLAGIMGEVPALNYIDRILNVNNSGLIGLEYIGLGFSVIPLSVFAGRVTRRVNQRIDRFINPPK